MFSLAATVQPYQLQEQDSGSGEETSSGEDDMSLGNPVRMIASSAEGVPISSHAQEAQYQEAALQHILTGTPSHVLSVLSIHLCAPMAGLLVYLRVSSDCKTVALLCAKDLFMAVSQEVAPNVKQHQLTDLWPARRLPLASKRSLR